MHSEIARAAMTQSGLNLIAQALSIFDSDLRLVVCNRRYQDLFDLPDRLTTPGATFEETVRFLAQKGDYGPVDVDEAVAQRVAQARAFLPHYLERTRADGRTISVEGAPLAQGGWVTVYTDITAIKAQEALLRGRSEELSVELLAHAERLSQANRELAATNAQLEEAKRALTEMEARTRLVTEMTPAHIAHVDADLRYTFSNRRLADVMPGAASPVLGKTGAEALGAETFAKIEPALRRALAGEAQVFEITHEPSARRIRIALSPDRNGAGVYILTTDVTEETQTRAALTQTAKRELAAKLTSGLAHDFANLLTIILGLQGRLERLPGLPPEAREITSATLTAARRGGRLLDRLATISGRRAPRPVATDLGDLFDELAAMASAALPGQIALDFHHADLGPLLLDAGSLTDALINLILNARDAIGPHPGRIGVFAHAVRETWLEITVTDSGPGFTPSALERATDPFFTTKGGEGSGLGLSMVYDHAKISGGSLRIENRREGGAAVTLRLPLRRAGAVVAPMMVLLVEDSDAIRAEVREMLRALGHSVLEAASADEGLALADLPGLGLVLSDITLPGRLNGVDLAEALAARNLPVCLMTSLPPAAPERLRAQAFPLLSKPFTQAELSALIGGAFP